MKTIKLTQDRLALVDDEDFEFLNQWKWQYHDGYATRKETINGKSKIIRMHRVVAKTQSTQMVDHLNGDTTDNQKKNLRNCTRSQNGANRVFLNINNTSGYKGVVWHKRERKWRAQIKHNNKRIHLGSFDNPVDAAKAYDIAAFKYFGEFANTNF